MAAFLTATLRSTISRALGSGTPGFPYSVGEKETTYDGIWSLHKGTKKEDGTGVSIFIFDITKQKDKLPLAKNAFRRFRTLRHPELLRYIDGLETETHLYVVTDPVVPLSKQLEKEQDENLTMLGLLKLATAVQFLNKDCGMIHGNVRISSVFANKAGEWKLGGFETVSSLKDEPPSILANYNFLPDAVRYSSPEIKRSSIQVIKDLPVGAMDAWQYAMLVYEVYNGYVSSLDHSFSKGKIPQGLYARNKSLLDPEPKSRLDISDFIDSGTAKGSFFDTHLVIVNDFLENLNIKEGREKDNFFRKLDSEISEFPSQYCIHKILPELVKALEFGAGGSKVLGTILKIGSKLDEEDYKQIVVNSVVKMFASPDRAIRMSLLENMDSYVKRLDKKTIAEKIFPHIALGFTDAAPPLREATVKSVLLWVPKLPDRLINNDILRYLAKLQMDEEPGIRTNTTICLGKIAQYLNEATRKKVLASAFSRSLRDPFFHARNAALMAFVATIEYYPPEEVASKIIPSISGVLLDPEKPVRTQAFKTLELFTKRLEVAASAMPDTAQPPQISPIGGLQSSSADATSLPTVAGNSSANVTEGWAGWAVSSLTSKLTSVALDGEISSAPSNGSRSSAARQSGLQQDPYVPSQTSDAPSFAASPALLPKPLQIGDEDDASGWEPFDLPVATRPKAGSAKVKMAASTPMKLGSKTTKLPDELEAWSSQSPPPPQPNISVATFEGTPWDDVETSIHRPPPLPNLSMNSSSSTDFGIEQGWGPDDVSPAGSVSSPGTSNLSRDERRAELNRKREERRQRMLEAKDKRKTTVGPLGVRKP